MSDARQAAKNWRRRNSDFRDTFEGARSESPPSFTIEESPLPMTEAQRIASREDPEGVAQRHVHVWGVEEPA